VHIGYAADHSPPATADICVEPLSSLPKCLHVTDGDSFTFTDSGSKKSVSSKQNLSLNMNHAPVS